MFISTGYENYERERKKNEKLQKQIDELRAQNDRLKQENEQNKEFILDTDKIVDFLGDVHYIIRDSSGAVYVDFHTNIDDFCEETIIEHRDMLFNCLMRKHTRRTPLR